jgi:amino acid adenylation domain-containing protein
MAKYQGIAAAGGPAVAAEAPVRTVVAAFEEKAALHPHKPAVRSGGSEMTFGELDRAANRLARRIVEVDGNGNRPVAALLREGLKPPVALLGTLKAGKCYVPLDAAHNEGRLEYMLGDSTAITVVTDGDNLALAKRLAPEAGIVNMDEAGRREEAAAAVATDEDDLALILYTSGSTGEPKGVVSTVGQLAHASMEWRQGGYTAEDRLACFASFAFAGGCKVQLRAAVMGATIVLGIAAEMDRLPEMLAAQRVTWLSASPSVLRHLVRLAKPGMDMPDLRMVYVGGEQLLKSDLKAFRAAFGRVPLVNGLAMTEAGMVSEYRAVDAKYIEGDAVPVGYALPGREVTVVDSEMRPVRPGEVGQIVIRGSHMASGYWRRPDLTAQRFVTDPDGRRAYLTGDLGRMDEDGCTVHLGRADRQVKIRAHKVELAEVEAALAGCPEVAAAAAAAREDAGRDKRIVAYYVARPAARPTVSGLRRHMASVLPEYMLPTAFVEMAAMPMTPNGKLDRAALPEPGKGRPALETEFATPRGPVEQAIATIWSEVLEVTPVGASDRFDELGGHSLRASMVLARIADRLGVDIPMREFATAHTVEQLAAAVVERLARAAGADMDAMLDEPESGAGG